MVAPSAEARSGLRRPAIAWPTSVVRSAPAALLGLAIVILWQALAPSGGAVPPPSEVGRALWHAFADGDLGALTARSVGAMALAFSVSVVVGVSGGLLLATRTLADRAVSPYLVGLQSLPSIVWIPVAVLVLGASESAVLLVTVVGALPSIAIGTRDAVQGVPPLILRAARTLGTGRRSMLLRVIVPAALPGIVSGLEHGWAFAFRALISGELITGAKDTGLGAFIDVARKTGHSDRLFAGVVVILLVGVVVDRLLFARVQRRLRLSRGLA